MRWRVSWGRYVAARAADAAPALACLRDDGNVAGMTPSAAPLLCRRACIDCAARLLPWPTRRSLRPQQGDKTMRIKHCLAAAGLFAVAAGVHAQETFKLGVVTFLSGPAAESFGVPAANGAKLM